MVNFDRIDGGVIRLATTAGLRLVVKPFIILVLFLSFMNHYGIPTGKEYAAAAIEREIHVEFWPANSTEGGGRQWRIKTMEFRNELDLILRKTKIIKVVDEKTTIGVKNGNNNTA